MCCLWPAADPPPRPRDAMNIVLSALLQIGPDAKSAARLNTDKHFLLDARNWAVKKNACWTTSGLSLRTLSSRAYQD